MNSSVSALPLSTLDSANEALTLRLPSSLQLKQQLPLSHSLHQQVTAHRQAVRAILDGEDPRLLVIVGPCSIHDPQSAIEYASKLARLAEDVSSEMLLVMRAYVEKPRTTIGWKGLAYDPHLDGTDDMAAGLTLSRELMLEMIRLGLPVATELLQPMAANYFDDLLSWVAIGARTTESQIHREMASGLNMPVGFKNGTDGGAAVAVDAMRSAAHPHRHFGVDSQGHPAIVQTAGNADTHIVLRGGHQGPNYDATSVANISAELSRLKIPSRIMVDCSHANSGKDPLRQPAVFNDVLEQRLRGNHSLIGMMLESHLFEGCQPLSSSLRYGVSITDGCLGFDATERLLTDAARRVAQAER
ncbi:phospho-2-dehydro-3-deoxyheptonate aldolase [Pseudomonas atacamensis]|uniref:Phospho-2-dehydro-3-deoxyheptonate aldolase n=1 Tax=Pseudomonas atacamensis TaxID=2565368 RepID=A0ABQ5PHT9_9PSED|nr:3-deoxy-7-phosphoheptulonate synthase [Pseudomonas atacamensis]GLH43078.1 phospho-2-dehydro-3-deoxyheptonate aldolase [Pseudomonas atacamensis]GLH55417.1 phospho-2-dehydro-3-deoxyheptonate aldolase [Pseudomonas atacamensis]